MSNQDMLKEAGRQLQEEVDRQLALWGTEGWVSGGDDEQGNKASDAASSAASPSIATGMDMEDPDAMAAMFFAQQKAKQKKAETLPVKILARNIVWLAKQQNGEPKEHMEMDNAAGVPVENQGKKELVDHLCQKFREYQQM